MKIKHIFSIFLILTLVTSFFTACDKRESANMKLVDGFITDNSPRLADLNMHKYEIQELKAFFGEYSINENMIFGAPEAEPDLTINNVNRKFPIECLRFNNDCYYTIYEVKSGGYFYVFWIKSFSPESTDSDTSSVRVCYSAYLSSLKNESLFGTLRDGISTASDVFLIAPSTEISFLRSSGTYSYSLLDNGKLMQIEYTLKSDIKNRDDLIVKEKKVISKINSGSNLSAIISSDLP